MSFGSSDKRLQQVDSMFQWDPDRTRSELPERHCAKLPSPDEFVDGFCKRRGLVSKTVVGTNPVERQCIQRAEEARQEYKNLRNAVSTESISILTHAAKYEQRLQNNRKSAAAAKVFNDVLKREHSTLLQKLSSMDEIKAIERIRILERENAELRLALRSTRNGRQKQSQMDSANAQRKKDSAPGFTFLDDSRHPLQCPMEVVEFLSEQPNSWLRSSPSGPGDDPFAFSVLPSAIEKDVDIPTGLLGLP